MPVAGGSLRVESLGAGPAIVLLHGWTLDRRIWRPQAPLASRHRLILIDRRGFGESTAPPDLAAESDDIAAVQDRLDLGPTVVAGLSQGGRVALEFAARFPERVRGLVLVGAPLRGYEPAGGPEEIPLADFAALARAGEFDALKRRWRSHPLMRVAAPSAAALLDEIVGDYRARDLLPAALAPAGPTPERLHAIAVPALVVTGADEPPRRARAGDAIARALPDARRLVLPDAGHLCSAEQPDAFNRALAEFAAALPAAEGGAD